MLHKRSDKTEFSWQGNVAVRRINSASSVQLPLLYSYRGE